MNIKCGIYKITNIKNNKSYIGYSKNISRRWRYHLSNLRRSIHSNKYLQRAWNKYGESSFCFEILKECKEKDLERLEKYYISFYETLTPNGYNLSSGGRGNFNWKMPKEILEKMKIYFSRENNPMWGRHHSKKTKKLFSLQRKGNKNGLGNKNNLNKLYKRKNSSSIYFGVYFKYKRWVARISINGKDFKIGSYKEEKEAALAFDEKSWEIHKDLNLLNFPELRLDS